MQPLLAFPLLEHWCGGNVSSIGSTRQESTSFKVLGLELWKYTPYPWTSRFTSSSRIITICSSVKLTSAYRVGAMDIQRHIYIWASGNLRQLNNAPTSCDPWDIRIVLHAPVVGGGLKLKFFYQNDTFLKILMSWETKLFSPAIVFATSFTKLGIPELLRKVHIIMSYQITVLHQQ